MNYLGSSTITPETDIKRTFKMPTTSSFVSLRMVLVPVLSIYFSLLILYTGWKGNRLSAILLTVVGDG